MFRTDFNHWLQSFNNDLWYYLMEFISFLGNQYPLMIAALLIITVIHFKKGILVLNILAITSLATIVLKSKIDFPRPLAVDKSLNTFKVEGTKTDLTHLQPDGIFEIFDKKLLTVTRQQEHLMNQGLPSGHTSMQTALWLSLALLFRKKWIAVLSIVMVGLTMISRMYLGLHYLGDVTGGLLLGITCVLLTYKLAEKSGFLKNVHIKIEALVYLIFPISFIIFEEGRNSWQLWLILGVNALIFVLFRKEIIPELSLKKLNRLSFFLVFTFLFLFLFYVAKSASNSSPLFIEHIFMFLAGFLSLFFSIKIALKLNWLIRVEKT